MSTIAVLGRGIAGAAAVWAARRAGAQVLSFGGAALTTAMSSGAADDEPWELGVPPRPLGGELGDFLRDLGGWVFPEQTSAIVATSAGVLRPARGHDQHVLDLASLPGSIIGVPRLNRPHWDADALALAWNGEPLATTHDLRFQATDVELLHRTDEQVLPEVDLAARIAERPRRAQLDHRLASVAATGRFAALLVPPGLGLPESAPLRTGETLSPPGGPAGARLAHALIPLFPPETAASAVVELTHDGHSPAVTGAPRGSASPGRWEVDAVVIAVGGLLGGGIAFRRTDPGAVLSPIPGFFTGCCVDVLVGQHGDQAAVELPLGEARWSHASGGLLERVGILHLDGAVRRPGGGTYANVFVAGDAAAGRARTLLASARDGIASGRRAAAQARTPGRT